MEFNQEEAQRYAIMPTSAAFKDKVKRSFALVSGATLLDVGAGTGYMCDILKDQFECYSLEPNSFFNFIKQTDFPVKIEDWQGEHFDVILCNSSLYLTDKPTDNFDKLYSLTDTFLIVIEPKAQSYLLEKNYDVNLSINFKKILFETETANVFVAVYRK